VARVRQAAPTPTNTIPAPSMSGRSLEVIDGIVRADIAITINATGTLT
jgi:hypothetical protein